MNDFIDLQSATSGMDAVEAQDTTQGVNLNDVAIDKPVKETVIPKTATDTFTNVKTNVNKVLSGKNIVISGTVLLAIIVAVLLIKK